MIEQLADWIVYGLLGLNKAEHLSRALHFFIYDSTKIILLLFGISILMGIVNSYLPIDKLKNYLTTKKLYGMQYFFASLFGCITPFCSCSSIPLFIGFVKGGIPLGVTFAFLITSPLVNEVAIAMFLGTFGVKITLIYVGTGILFGMIGGFILEKLKLNHLLSDWVLAIQKNSQEESVEATLNHKTFAQRMPEIVKEAFGITKGVIIYIIIGIAIGALMHGYVPEGFFQQYLSAEHWWAIPLATLLAIPMYSNAAGVIPIIQVFVAKGIPLGTAIAFMMGVVGLSLPEATLLSKVMKAKLIIIFFSLIGLFIMISGYLFNWVL